jgi:hypothetical protein
MHDLMLEPVGPNPQICGQSLEMLVAHVPNFEGAFEWACVQHLLVPVARQAWKVRLVANPRLGRDLCERRLVRITSSPSTRVKLRSVTAILPLAAGTRRIRIAWAT